MQPTDPIATARHEVERRLGLCLLQLQAYEMRLKDIVARHDLSAPVDKIADARAKRQKKTRERTMGGLITDLLDTFLVADGRKDGAPERNDAPSVTFRMQVVLSDKDMEKTAEGLKELVTLRNTLVHHFLKGHDLLTEEGCTRALEYLDAALARIAVARQDLNNWKSDLDQTLSILVRHLQSSELQ